MPTTEPATQATPQPCPELGLEPAELYDIGREQIRHEDGLINHRTTWFLVFEGLLFTAALNIVANLLPKSPSVPSKYNDHLLLAAATLGLLGVVGSVVAYLSVRAAYAKIREVEAWWKKQAVPDCTFPRLAGEGGFTKFGHHFTAADMFLALGLAWVILLAALFHAARSAA